MSFELPALPYAKTPGAAHFRRNPEYHYGKHHRAYVTNLNNLIKGTAKASPSKRSSARLKAVFNNAAQVWNHTFTGTARRLTPGGEPPQSPIRQLRDFKAGPLPMPRRKFRRWLDPLVKNADGSPVSTSNAGTPADHRREAAADR